jgi:hypothetical protein
MGKRVKNQNHTCTIHRNTTQWEQFYLWANLQNFPIHVIRALDIDVFLYPTLTIQASSRLKRSDNHLWNNSDVCRKKFGEWSLLMMYYKNRIFSTRKTTLVFLLDYLDTKQKVRSEHSTKNYNIYNEQRSEKCQEWRYSSQRVQNYSGLLW